MSIMTEEEKQAAEAAQAEFEASLEGLSEEEKAQKIAEKETQNNADPDVEEALKIERERRERAEAQLEETRRKAKERFDAKKRKEAEEGKIDDDKPLTKAELREMFDEERNATRKEMREEQALKLAKELAENDTEAELVLEVWKNRTLVGTLSEQLEEAYAIATRKRTQKQSAELKRALLNKDGVKTDGANAQRKPTPSSEPKIATADKTVLVGYVWDSGRNAYKKLIAKGTKFFYVSRDFKKKWTEDAK